MRQPGVEPGAQAWEACMLPLHYWRSCIAWPFWGSGLLFMPFVFLLLPVVLALLHETASLKPVRRRPPLATTCPPSICAKQTEIKKQTKERKKTGRNERKERRTNKETETQATL